MGLPGWHGVGYLPATPMTWGSAARERLDPCDITEPQPICSSGWMLLVTSFTVSARVKSQFVSQFTSQFMTGLTRRYVDVKLSFRKY